ncbi:MAG: RtcB family protein [Deinococcota bacterium]
MTETLKTANVIYGQHDDKTLDQLSTCLNTGSATAGVLCADGHLGYGHPIGGVVGYTDHISISGIGFDIACGNMAVRLDTRFEDVHKDTNTILEDITKVVSFGVGRANDTKVDHDLFDSDLWTQADVAHLKELARDQLGTVGSGNHYVDLFFDDDGFVWIGVHFGSRGLGHKITTQYLKAVGAKDNMMSPPALIEADSDLGRGYLAGIELGGMYAYAGREWVIEQVRNIIGGDITLSVHNHHNYCWRETHNGVDMWVVRKGATPAFPNQLGFVGGSMGDDAVILKGVESEESQNALYSTVHGAGRVMSRREAKGKRHRKTGKLLQEPKVQQDEWDKWLADKNVTLVGGDLDEAPQAYRRLPDVLEEHKGTIEILHTLHPFGVIMAGKNEFDPYKD